jgi:hypothetical protein
MEDIGIVLGTSGSLTYQLKPIEIPQAVDLKWTQPNEGGMLHQYLDAWCIKSALKFLDFTCSSEAFELKFDGRVGLNLFLYSRVTSTS